MEHANLSCEGDPENSKRIVAPPRGCACWPAREVLTANYARAGLLGLGCAVTAAVHGIDGPGPPGPVTRPRRFPS